MTRFDEFKQTLTAEEFARMVVKVVIINNAESYYVTSTGQLYPMTTEGFQMAVNHEIQFWNQELTQKENDTEKSL